MDFHGKVVLVTGGSRGIGKSIAFEFARCNASVIINYRNNDMEAEKTIEDIKELGGYCEAIKGDVKDYSFAKKMTQSIIDKYGKIDVLINNAGISKVGLFMDMTEKDFDDIVGVNLKGVFNTCSNVVKHMIERKKGSIVNISSIWGGVGASCEVLYSASKGGVNSFTKALGKELAPSGIRVNGIQPGVIDTDMNKWMSQEDRKALTDEIPISRFGEGEDIAKLAIFLASDESKYITSQIITVDGGYI
ncbi:SDR family oxidoreductase [Clostridium sp. MB40-C1]|uniref:elongation factor P 5-aminopentanone reductase n=1 Tax=Clostridium sp. MB40-C1 TaxID=3070996 RepID=UPI0027E18793|nr:SDR family oxidoreductase [Clostridium sp. MB40-C1]WMJ79441.1 SDR family oxidoreductase [Clostridium sp. MB40-C1]